VCHIICTEVGQIIRKRQSFQLPYGYHELLQELKGRIRTAQVCAGLAVSRENLISPEIALLHKLSLPVDRMDNNLLKLHLEGDSGGDLHLARCAR
jgi:hypothetical protein